MSRQTHPTVDDILKIICIILDTFLPLMRPRTNLLNFGEHWLTERVRHLGKSGRNRVFAIMSKSLNSRVMIFGGYTLWMVRKKSYHFVLGCGELFVYGNGHFRPSSVQGWSAENPTTWGDGLVVVWEFINEYADADYESSIKLTKSILHSLSRFLPTQANRPIFSLYENND